MHPHMDNFLTKIFKMEKLRRKGLYPSTPPSNFDVEALWLPGVACSVCGRRPSWTNLELLVRPVTPASGMHTS